jgi:hypothetical protein
MLLGPAARRQGTVALGRLFRSFSAVRPMFRADRSSTVEDMASLLHRHPVPHIHPGPSPYRRLLETAYEMGLADAGLARRLGLAEDPTELGVRCRGRSPDEFAGWLWRDRPDPAPAGLVNAGAWYLQGFRDGLAAR